ncbi:hypothetical protein CVT26_015592 [Gymnopilus dilepis]|uniref:Uncharacterized protein n=1 Tax=Gymnopilus dilepis TaxID=231916 RepID=A0A409XYS7_9AGAR|nr:hypothetical protein CVT26_015592 [Gymnopilus dilepis]
MWEGFTTVIACILAETILTMRIYALYHRRTVILRLVIFCCFSCWTASGIIIGLGVHTTSVTAIVLETPSGKICFNQISPKLYLFWIPILFYESLLFVLAFCHGVEMYRISPHGRNVSTALDHQGLSDIFVRDSVIYFIALGTIYFTTLLFWLIEKNPLIEVPSGISFAISSVLGSRLILNLREADAESISGNLSNQGISRPLAFSSLSCISNNSPSHCQ